MAEEIAVQEERRGGWWSSTSMPARPPRSDELVQADAFGAFKDAGLDEPGAELDTGRRFRSTVLSLGGSRHPMEVFKEFRGREPSTMPLLEQTGLI